jgi:hypothetical protein
LIESKGKVINRSFAFSECFQGLSERESGRQKSISEPNPVGNQRSQKRKPWDKSRELEIKMKIGSDFSEIEARKDRPKVVGNRLRAPGPLAA